MAPKSPVPTSTATTSTTASNINPALTADEDTLAARQILKAVQNPNADSAQILALLQHLPGVFHKVRLDSASLAAIVYMCV
jgi:hypothetical protein